MKAVFGYRGYQLERSFKRMWEMTNSLKWTVLAIAAVAVSVVSAVTNAGFFKNLAVMAVVCGLLLIALTKNATEKKIGKMILLSGALIHAAIYLYHLAAVGDWAQALGVTLITISLSYWLVKRK